MTVNLLGGDEFRPRRASGEWLWPLLPLGVSAFALSALVSYHVRQPLGSSALQRAIIGVYEAIGFVPAFFFFLLLFSWSSIWFVTGRIVRPWARLSRLLAFTVVIASAMNLQYPPGQGPVHLGAIGGWVAGGLLAVFGYWLSALVVVPLALATFLLATDFCFYRYFERSLPGRSPGESGPQIATAELGVEHEVADHLKSLAAATGTSATWEPARSEGVASAVATMIDAAARVSREERDEPSPGLGTDGQEPRRRRRSHHERRVAPHGEDHEPAGAAQPGASGEGPGPAVAGELTVTGFPGGEAAAPGAGAPAEPLPEVITAEGDTAEADAADATRPPGRVRGKLAPIVETDADLLGEDLEFAPTVDDANAANPAPPVADPEILRARPVEEPADADEVPTAESRAEEEALEVEPAPLDGGDDEDDELADPDAMAAEEAEAGVAADEDAEEPRDEGDPVAAGSENPVVLIPRSPEGARQRRMFEPRVDEALIEEAIEIARSGRRVSAGYLQRKLRIDYEQARDLIAVLAQRGVIGDDEVADTGRR